MLSEREERREINGKVRHEREWGGKEASGKHWEMLTDIGMGGAHDSSCDNVGDKGKSMVD